MRRIAFAVATAVLLGAAVLGPAGAGASVSYAPINQPGPALRPSAAALAASVVCSGDFHNGKEPVLLVPGTAFTYQTQYSWSWAPALTRAGIPWCSVSPPYSQLGDLTIAGEYDVYAIRHTYQLAGDRKIAIVGHSQGGMQPRWALRFWPDTRAMVADYVGVSPDSQGVDLGAPALVPALLNTACPIIGCPQGVWQQIRGSQFTQAVNSLQQTFPGIDYTVIYSQTDELVRPSDTPLDPAPGTAYTRTAIQDICPGRIVDHLEDGSVDAATWAMIMDAITHPGPLDPARVSRAVCKQLFIPGLSPVVALQHAVGAVVQIAKAVATTPRQAREATLPSYVFAR